MADPICRWRNSSVKQVIEFNNLFPLKSIEKHIGREIVENRWNILGGNSFFTTPYQLAAQMGIYYEEESLMTPRFEKLINLEEAQDYIFQWAKNYYAPNPYTKSITEVKPVVINNFLVNYAQENQNANFSLALKEMFGDNSIGNTDILVNMLNSFSEVEIDTDGIVTVKPWINGKKYSEEEIYPPFEVNDKKSFFGHFDFAKRSICISCDKVSDFALQVFIFFQNIDELKAFLPFVSESKARSSESDATLIKLQSEEFSDTLVGLFIETDLEDLRRRNTVTNTTRWFEDKINFNGRTVFVSNQWNADGSHQLTFPELKTFIHEAYNGRFEAERTPAGKFILVEVGASSSYTLSEPLQQIYYGAPGTGKSFHADDVCKKHEHYRTTFHPDSDYSTFVGCYKPTMGKPQPIYGFDSVGKTVKVLDSNNSEVTRKEITYSFVPQSFTNAYIKAWELHESNTPVFLVVEEINRGNCAQIFGDLFQLLDRNDEGYSTYEITPDTDLQDYISQQGLNISGIKDSDGKDISAEIASGKLMKLPNNLHIWATMNTSDQSLFPIDSAFKRRWDWVYKPIKYSNESWKVVLADGSWCWWVDLQQTLNDLIYDATESEDKMLGDWFVRAENNVISEEVLVGKIIFYLWNDVAKVDAGKLFDLEVEKNGRKPRKVIFSDFYKTNEKIDSKVVKDWLNNINVAIFEKDIADDDPEYAALTDSKPEYVRILDEIEAKCKEQGVENKVKGNSINIKLGDYAMSKLRVAVSLNNTGTPNADVKLWISSSSAKSIDTRDKLRKYGAGVFFENLAKESDKLSCGEIGNEYPDSESRTRGWRLTSTAITFEEAKASEEAEWILDKIQRIREHFATALD